MDEIAKIKQLLETDRPVDWEQIPDIDLYMDQVISYLPRQSLGGKVPGMTSAMVNNYVKDGLMPRASGKRYHREHLAYLTVISHLKNVLTVKDMKLLLSQVVEPEEAEAFYEDFLRSADTVFTHTNQIIPETISQEELAHEALMLALYACAAKTACEHFLSVILDRQEVEKKAAPKNKGK